MNPSAEYTVLQNIMRQTVKSLLEQQVLRRIWIDHVLLRKPICHLTFPG